MFAKEDTRSIAENRVERKVLIDRAEITDRWGEKEELKGLYIGFLNISSVDRNMCGYSEKYVRL